mgnify:CR=1 FL=1
MKVLLTGAFGNVGYSVLEKLTERGYKTTVFDLKNKNNINKISKLTKTDETDEEK